MSSILQMKTGSRKTASKESSAMKEGIYGLLLKEGSSDMTAGRLPSLTNLAIRLQAGTFMGSTTIQATESREYWR
jgi:hypothetical protein